MIDYTTLTQALTAHLAEDKGITYVSSSSKDYSVSYQDLQQRALGILYYLQEQGISPGCECIFYLDDNEQFIDAFWACLFGKIIPVPIAVGNSDSHRLKIFTVLKKLNNPFLYTSRKNLDRLRLTVEQRGLQADFARLENRILLADNVDAASRPGQRYEADPDDIAFIQFSSGSTGDPKGVVLTHRNLMTNIKAIIASCRITSADSMLSWMPLTHDMGIIGFHMTPVVSNSNHYILPTELFVRRPLFWLEKTSEVRASLLSSPNFGYKHFLKVFDPTKIQTLDLACVRLIFNGAEPISADLCEEFLGTLERYGLSSSAMFPVYGLAEASLAVTFPAPATPIKTIHVNRQALTFGAAVEFLTAHSLNALRLISVGKPIPECQVRISDSDGHVLGEKRIGHIQITGANVTAGYYNDSAATQNAFTIDGWLDTGDLGFFFGGELYVTGRAKDVIIIHGANYYPHDLEFIVATGSGLELGKVVVCGVREEGAVTDELLVFLLFRGEIEEFVPLASSVKKLMSEQLGLELKHVMPLAAIPKTTSGKIQRYSLAQNYLKGEYASVLDTMHKVQAELYSTDTVEQTQIERQLMAICESVVTHQLIGIHDDIFDAGINSLKLVEVHEKIEEVFPGLLEITDFFDYPTIAELAAHLTNRLNTSHE